MRARHLLLTIVVVAAAATGFVYRDRLAPMLGLASSADAAKPAAAKPASPGVAIVSSVTESSSFPIRRRTIGLIETPASVVLKSRIDSQILKQHVTDGQTVAAGELLFTLDDREIRAAIARDEAVLARDQATADRTKTNLTRMKELLARDATSQAQLDQATADSKSAEATVAGDQATLTTDKIKLSYTQITAPMAGRIGAVRVAPGNLVSSNDPSGLGLLTITQIKPIRVAFTLPERELPRIRSAMLRKPPPQVRVFQAGTTTVLASGQIDFLDSAVDTGSGTIIAKANFPNDDLRLWPGMYVDVQIDLDMRPDTITVPTPAVQIGQNGSYVYVVKADKTIEARDVTVLGAEGEKTAIEKGLKAGEHVVIEGQLRVAPGSRVTESVRSDATPQGEAAIHREDRT